jgi:hypothetical protein
MYRQGLGDCFLVSFGESEERKHILIDCGTLGGTTNPANTMSAVVRDIHDQSGGRLSVLIATHEHKDHLSGFISESEVFDTIGVDHVWLAWTEDQSDPVARTIAVYKRDLAMALGASLGATGEESGAKHEGAEARRRGDMAAIDILGFAGDPSRLAAGKFAETIDRAMRAVRDKAGARASYHKPGGRPIELASIPGFRFYMLGPPRENGMLADLGRHGSSELYGLRAVAMAREAAGLDGQSGTDAELCELEMPFDQRYRTPLDRWNEPLYPGYYDAGARWRRADHDWRQSASDLALQLDSITNNTSLALAIERVADGRVLLFPADAQQGSWLSWHGLEWTVAAGAGPSRRVTTRELLERTVFYKAGHHASHNGTARGRGLELMLREEELTAFIPVDRRVALNKSPKGSWQMPARPLLLRLLQKCRGRVVRSDIGWVTEVKASAGDQTEQDFVGIADQAQWAEWRAAQRAASHVQVEPLFVDFNLH